VWVALTGWRSLPRSERRTAAELLDDAQRRVAPRVEPQQAREAVTNGALLVDLRSQDERRRDGVIPGSVHIPRSVLEWRVDPDSGYANPHIDFDKQVIVFCAHGFSSTFAAVTLRELGHRAATDMVGGFAGWKAAGLPTREFQDVDDEDEDGRLPGMGGPALSGR
jgi:rhodanese-related sulfurtransferase